MKNWRRLGMKSKLSDICFYAKGKVNVSGLTDADYISTENMLPNKGGITTASSLPSTIQTQAYKKDDVLVSNIRPYFKKIWFADFDGGCSNDVLVLRAKEGTDARFLYYVLADDAFFDYSTATSKGTKMPRGDKTAIMQYEVPHFDLPIQKKIAGILADIDGKIALNSNINKNLEQQAQAIFKSWFVDFEPFNGEMPHNWIVSRLGDIASIKTNIFSPVKNPDAQLEHYSIPAYDEQKYPVFESAAGVKSNKYILSKNSVMISKLNPDTKRVWRPMCLSELAVSSTEFIIFEAFNPAYRDFVFSIIDSTAFSDWMCAHTTGSTNSRQRTAPSATLEFQVALPDEKAITDFCAIVTPMYDTIASNICENQKLAQLRNSILPKLMSGELDVSDIDL